MKKLVPLLIFMLSPAHVRGGEEIFPYSAFGPQAAAYELIGMQWWQWDSHGEPNGRDYPIKVVVFWDQTREETAKRYPVDKSKLQDFRYVEYAKAVEYLEKTIMDFKKLKLKSAAMNRALVQIQKRKAEQGAVRRSRGH